MPEIDLVIEKIDGRDVIKPAEPIPKGAKNVVYHLPTMKVTFEMEEETKQEEGEQKEEEQKEGEEQTSE